MAKQAMTAAQALQAMMQGITLAKLTRLAGDAVTLAVNGDAKNVKDAAGVLMQKWLSANGASVNLELLDAIIVNAINPNMPIDGVSSNPDSKA